MNKSKLTTELISNALDFYNKNLGEVFSRIETENLSKKLLNIIEYDHIIKSPLLPYDLPQYTLTIIYFIGEYKKAYMLSSKEEKEKRVDTHEAIGQRNEPREKLLNELIQTSEDKTKSESTRIVSAIRAFLLEPLVDESTQKRGWLQLGSAYIMLIWFKRIFEPFLQQTYDDKTVYQLVDESLELFSFTAVANSKISNTLAILLYDVLTNKMLKTEPSKAISWTRDIIGKYIEKTEIPRDRYRLENFSEREIYFVGFYNKMPVFQWYIPKNKKTDVAYYSEQDLQEILNLTQKMRNDTIGNIMYHYGTASIGKSLKKNPIEFQKQLDENYTSIKDFYKEIKALHKQYALLPLGLFQHIIITPLSRKERLFSFIIGIYSKFTHLFSKFTQK